MCHADLAEDERDGVCAVLEVVDRPLEGARGLGCCQRVLQRVAAEDLVVVLLYGFDLAGLVRQAGVEPVLYFPVGVRGEAQGPEIRVCGKGGRLAFGCRFGSLPISSASKLPSVM